MSVTLIAAGRIKRATRHSDIRVDEHPDPVAEFRRARGSSRLVEAETKGLMAVMNAWTREGLEAVALVETPSTLKGALRAYANTGIAELSLVLINDPEAQPEVVKQLAAARP